MKRVVLLVTGQTEKALGSSLQRVFSNVEFVVRQPWTGFTSNALPEKPLLKCLGDAREETYLEKLVGLLVSEVAPGRRNEKPADMVVLVDDLELCNAGWPERVIGHVRTAVQAYVDHYPWTGATSRERALDQLRTRCSFHLLCPMIESYFFSEAEALTRAGAKRASKFDAAVVDAEQFCADEPEFLLPPNRVNKDSAPQWATDDRAKHPKRYLQFLCDPAGVSLRPYFESDNPRGRPSGEAALRHLDWALVFGNADYVRFIRSLFFDIADALDETEIAERFAGTTHPLTWPPSANNVLRNI